MNKNFDEIDRQLLALLQDDASLTNVALARRVGVSPATCLRRVQRLRELGVIERQVAIVNPWALAEATGQPPGLMCVVEVSLEQQAAEHLQAFEALAVAQPQVQQCWRVASGPDFVLVVQAPTMAQYQEFAERVFTQHANVRNVKAFFATRRAKFSTAVALPQ
ncbi:AsnC family transcriptional regulator [Lampropedia cohaerens]|uniref:AsnC family transcriptional regulator n=1 Tax=Lampropedia cohaerens TaxID=1610491 RepID=A0A0U1PZW7_9BURK|nr:Lrp/AsnC family transcriptional regulator [Lampropedia cohaerens]KKW68027.1 AsnC family transcriptional regulator [Lampropedia cohaerens]